MIVRLGFIGLSLVQMARFYSPLLAWLLALNMISNGNSSTTSNSIGSIVQQNPDRSQPVIVNWFRPTKSASDQARVSTSQTGVAFEVAHHQQITIETTTIKTPATATAITTTPLPNSDSSKNQINVQSAALIVQQVPVPSQDAINHTRTSRTTSKSGDSNVTHQSLSVVINHQFLVSHLCRRREQLMSVNIRTNQPFFGTIQALRANHQAHDHVLPWNQRSSQASGAGCSLDGNGRREFNLTFSYVQPIAVNKLDFNEANSLYATKYCGPMASKQFRSLISEEQIFIYSTLLAIQMNKQNQTPNDKLIALNCNQIFPCSSPNANCDTGSSQPKQQSGRLVNANNLDSNDWIRDVDWRYISDLERSTSSRREHESDCNIWKFPHLLVLFWFLAFLLLCLLASNCLMCLSLASKSRERKTQEKLRSIGKRSPSKTSSNTRRSHNEIPIILSYDNDELTLGREQLVTGRSASAVGKQRAVK